MVFRLSAHEAFLHQTQALSVRLELVEIPGQLHLPNLISSIEQEATEGVVVADVIAEETSNGQVDRHPVPGVQVDSHNDSGTVLLVLHVLLTWSCHHPAINLQTGAGSQRVTGGTSVTVDGEGEAVDTSAGNSEDTSGWIVAISEVDEDVLVEDELVITEGAEAFQTTLTGQSDREGAAAGWRRREEEKRVRIQQGKSISSGCSRHETQAPSLTSDIVEDGLCFCQFFLQLIKAHVEEHLHPVYLLLHQTAATRRLVCETH